jgi:hypothetical protein
LITSEDDMKIKPAVPAGRDVVNGIGADWFKIGRRYYGVTDTGFLIDAEGFGMSEIDDAVNVVGPVYDKNAHRVAESIRGFYAVVSKLDAIGERVIALQAMH